MNVKTAPVTASAPDIIANVPDGMQPIVLARQVEERLKSAPSAETSLVFVARDGRRLEHMADILEQLLPGHPSSPCRPGTACLTTGFRRTA